MAVTSVPPMSKVVTDTSPVIVATPLPRVIISGSAVVPTLVPSTSMSPAIVSTPSAKVIRSVSDVCPMVAPLMLTLSMTA